MTDLLLLGERYPFSIPVRRWLAFSASGEQKIKKINRIDASVGDIKGKKISVEQSRCWYELVSDTGETISSCRTWKYGKGASDRDVCTRRERVVIIQIALYSMEAIPTDFVLPETFLFLISPIEPGIL